MKNRIKECRVARGMTQTELSKKVGLAGGEINDYEEGKDEPTIYGWEKLASALHVLPAYLVGWTTKQPMFGNGAIVYLNDHDESYVELAHMGVSDENFVHGIEANGHKIHIPVSSVLYVEEDIDD